MASKRLRIEYRLISVSCIAVFMVSGSCLDVPEDPEPPVRPEWVQKSLPESFDERGIDADNTGKERIVLMWYQNQEEDLAGYEIYRADTSSDNTFKKIRFRDIFQVQGVDTMMFDDSVSNHVDYFYCIKARDISGNLSISSDTISYRLINAPECISPVNSTVEAGLAFEWMDLASNYEFSTEYVIRLENMSLGQTVWTARFTNIWYGYENNNPVSFQFFNCSDQQPDNLISCNTNLSRLVPGVYRWKIKAISEVDNSTNLDEASGESEWAYFTVD